MVLEELFTAYIEEDIKKPRKYGLSVLDAFEIINAHYGTSNKDATWIVKEALRTVELTDKADSLLYHKLGVKGSGHVHHIRNMNKFLELSIYSLPEAFLCGLLVKLEDYFNANCDKWCDRAARLNEIVFKVDDAICDHDTAVCSEMYYTESLRFTSNRCTEEYSMRAIMDSIEEYKNNR